MRELDYIAQSLDDSNIEEARAYLLALAYKLNKVKRLVGEFRLTHLSDVEEVLLELEELLEDGE
jgi:hypothetical protein